MSWNYRICKEVICPGTDYEEILFSLREVYYDNDSNITGYTANPVGLVADSIDDFKDTLSKIHEAINKEVVDLNSLNFKD